MIYASCTPTCACVEIHVYSHMHPLGAAPNFHACTEKKDKSAHTHVGVHKALDLSDQHVGMVCDTWCVMGMVCDVHGYHQY